MGQASCREDGDLLSSGDAVHCVNGGYPCLDHFLRVDTRPRIDGLPLDIKKVFCQDIGSFVSRSARTIEHTT